MSRSGDRTIIPASFDRSQNEYPEHTRLEYDKIEYHNHPYPSTVKNMPETVGQKLQRSRTERKLTLEQIAHTTHVRLHYLQALEEDRPEIMPSEAQGRGFLRLYAGYLGLPVKPLLDAWPDQLVAEEEIPQKTGNTPVVPSPFAPGSPEEENTPAHLQSAGDPADTVPVPSAARDTSPEIFQRIGNALRQQRDSLSLSIEDIENHTHIRSHYIQAMETGEIANLPSLAQARGMLKNYAQFLSMNADAVLLEYADGLQIRRLENMAPHTTSASHTPPTKTKLKLLSQIIPPAIRKWITPDMIVRVSAIALLVVIVVWGISQVTATRELTAEPTAPPISEMLLAENLAMLSATPRVAEIEVTRSPEENNAANPQANSEAPASGEGEASIPVLDNSPLQLYLVASQRAWVRVTADEEIVYEGRLVPGNAYPYSAGEKIDLLTGNGAGIKVYFNQTEVGILGEVGEVVAVSFTAAGMIIPTPQIPPTPTATPVTPTPTPGPTSETVLPTPTVTPFIP
jgi:cytoskeletal protein RodZ